MQWSDLLPNILIHVPGCPDTLVESLVHSVAVLFCQDTHAWVEQLPDIYPVAGVYRYSETLPPGADLHALKSSYQVSDNNAVKWPVAARINVYGLITFDDTLDATRGRIEIYGVLKPTATATGFPDGVDLNAEQALIHGTLQRLFSMPGRAWTLPAMATYHQRLYNDEVSLARNRRANGSSEMDQMVNPVAFY